VPAGPLDALRQHPQFAQLKELVQTNPTALPAVLSQLGSSSPDVLALINSNKDAFIALMNEPLTEEEEDALEGACAGCTGPERAFVGARSWLCHLRALKPRSLQKRAPVHPSISPVLKPAISPARVHHPAPPLECLQATRRRRRRATTRWAARGCLLVCSR